MKRVALLVAAGVFAAGCNDQNADKGNQALSRGGYTMNEPAGGSTKTNNASGSTFGGREGGSESSMSGKGPSGSRNPGPTGKTQPDNGRSKSNGNP